MSLKPLQKLWLIGTALFFAAVLLDVLGILEVPNPLLIVIPIGLFVISLVVGPSLKDLTEANRRG